MIYKAIQLGIDKAYIITSSEDENPQSRYFDGRLLPIDFMLFIFLIP
jgi:hypothetical protein